MDKTPEYAQLTEDELFAVLAAELYGRDTADFGPSDVRRRIEDAREWLDGWLARNQQKLCGELNRRGFLSPNTVDAIVDSAALIDIVIGIGLREPSAAIVAAIILKWGVQGLCR